MTKRQVIQEVRDVISGIAGHTVIAYGKNEVNKWETYTTISLLRKEDFDEWQWVSIERHSCNKMSLGEAAQIVNAAERYES